VQLNVFQVHLNGNRYIVDPGFQNVGPMKVEHLEVHVDPYNVFRLRNIPGENKKLLYMERHKKTVLDKDGEYMIIKAENFNCCSL